MPRTVVVVIGALSLAIAALFITRQTEIKRLMAYSSVEHMGVMTLGLGFGGPLGVAGALYHMLNHSLNKSLMFFGAGDAMHAFHTKRIRRIRHVLTALPVAGVLWILGALAITGAPPFGLFLSEVTIMRAGLAGPNAWAVFVMLVLLVVIFAGFLNHFRAMYFSAGLRGGSARGGLEASARDLVLVPAADVARDPADPRARAMVARGDQPLLHRHRLAVGWRASPVSESPDALSPAAEDLPLADLPGRCRAAVAAGARMQFVYAWYPGSPQDPELRYVLHPAPGQAPQIWRCRPQGESPPSLAAIAPLLSWYEREIMDLCHIRFQDHPQPEPLVLLPGARVERPPLVPGPAARVQLRPGALCAPRGPGPYRSGRPTPSLRTHPRRRARVRPVQVLLYR